MLTPNEIRVKEVLKEAYARHNPYTALAFADFFNAVASAKNMLTRHQKGTLACGEGVVVNAVVIIANALGPDTSLAFTTPAINEQQYPVVRSILHHLGLPYAAGPLDDYYDKYLTRIRAEMTGARQ